MLIIKKDDSRNYAIGQYMVELVNHRDYYLKNEEINRFGYWCDKDHLGHLFAAFFKYFTIKEILQIWHDGYWKS